MPAHATRFLCYCKFPWNHKFLCYWEFSCSYDSMLIYVSMPFPCYQSLHASENFHAAIHFVHKFPCHSRYQFHLKSCKYYLWWPFSCVAAVKVCVIFSAGLSWLWSFITFLYSPSSWFSACVKSLCSFVWCWWQAFRAYAFEQTPFS